MPPGDRASNELSCIFMCNSYAAVFFILVADYLVRIVEVKSYTRPCGVFTKIIKDKQREEGKKK